MTASSERGGVLGLSHRLPALLTAGFLLGLAELVLVVLLDRGLFLSFTEFQRYAVLALSAGPVGVWLTALCCQPVARALASGDGRERAVFARRLRRTVLLTAAPAAWAALWLLSTGRRVHDSPLRLPLVLIGGLAAAWLAASAARRLWLLEDAAARRRASRALAAVCVLALFLDSSLLRRLYPVFHLGLALVAVLSATCAGARWPHHELTAPRRTLPIMVGLLLLASVTTMLSMAGLANAPNARFAVEQAAPLSGKLLALSPRTKRSVAPRRVAEPVAVDHSQRGIDLSEQDVLLLTVDALRADRLRAYGGDGVTPQLDAIAQRSAVFTRAYTPTPHTSYALSSLLTGKFMEPVLQLSEAPGEHPTLPRLLRRYGYRTAAFYPPAIFFVDQQRFEWLRKDQLGFEYVKAMFAPAHDRVAQLDAYLRGVPAERPVFVWVHLFEPHEPYDPPPGFARGDSPVERYDGEVRAADAAIGELVELFERRRGADNTIIVSSDHGEEFGDHGGHHHGTTLFDEQVRVPLLWKSPSVVPRLVSAPVETLDIVTTLLSGLGVPRDARMRGDDLGVLLVGGEAPEGLHAFASVGQLRMVSDGLHKAICRGSDACSLYDLVADPGERRDISSQRPEVADRLAAALSRFAASIPEVEALAMTASGEGEGGGWPPALARARLGDGAAKAELPPLLGSSRVEVRAASAQAIGELGVASALNVLSRLRSSDEAKVVRDEAALAALHLGDLGARAQVLELLEDTTQPAERRRRAALVLAQGGERAAAELLFAAALDGELDESQRIKAIEALAGLGEAISAEPLLPLLDDVRLRTHVARALGQIGGRPAVEALRRALEVERYPAARRAEAEALLALGQKKVALRLIAQHLGSESSMPGGLEMMLEAGALAFASGGGADLRRSASVRVGPWDCEPRGCRPLSGASLALPARKAPRGEAKAVLLAEVKGTSRALTVGEERFWLNAGANEVAVALEDGRLRGLPVAADEGVLLQAVAVVGARRQGD